MTNPRPLAQEGNVQLTIAHDDGEVISVTGCEAMVDVEGGGSASSLAGRDMHVMHQQSKIKSRIHVPTRYNSLERERVARSK